MGKPEGKKKPNWEKIKAEYLAGGASYRKLCEKYSVPYSTMVRHAKAGGWIKKRDIVDIRADSKLIDAIAAKKTDAAATFELLVDGMEGRMAEAIALCNPRDAYSIKLLAGALKDLRDLRGMDKSALDKEEQRARIDRLRHEIEGDTDRDISITFGGGASEEWSK